MSQETEQDRADHISGTEPLKDTDKTKFIPGAMGERIAFLRKRKKLTQAQLAAQLGISAQAVSKWESGLSCPDIMTLVPLAQVLGVSTDELLGVLSGGETDWEIKGGEVPPAGPDESPDLNRDQGQDQSQDQDRNQDRDQVSGGDSVSGSEWTAQGESEPSGFRSLLVIPSRNSGMHEIRELQIGAGACAAVVQNGSDFGLELVGYQEGDIISEVAAGTWTVRDIADKRLIRIGRNTFSKRKMIITIPEGYHFDTVKFNIGAGTLDGAGIYADKSVLNVGAGQMTMKDFVSNASKITCGMGEIIVRGELYGKCSVDCGMGSIQLDIRKPEHYGYRASVGMGEVRIGGNKLSGIGGSQAMNAGDSNFYKVSCSMGMVNIAFTD